jgi:hypothetical protein
MIFMARTHSALRSAVSRYERVQPLRAAVGRKVERIINAGSVHTARDVALRSAVSRVQRRNNHISLLVAAADRAT